MIKKPQVWLILIFIVLFAWALSDEVRAEAVEVGLSYGAAHSRQHITQRIAYIHADKWIAQYERHGGNGYDDTNSVSFQRQVRWRQEKNIQPYLRFGASYFDDRILDPDSDKGRYLVDERLTFSLGFGAWFWKVLNLGIEHNSTAGRSDPNRGIDRIYLGFMLWL